MSVLFPSPAELAGNGPQDIDINQLVRMHEKKKDARMKTYMEIYGKCCDKIRYVNDVLYAKNCVFRVPQVLWGQPLFHLNAVIVFIMVKLRGKGFDVKFEAPDIIYIHWDKMIQKYLESRTGFTINYELSTDETTVPKPENLKGEVDERFKEVHSKGCGGDCCTNPKRRDKNNRRQNSSRKERLERARQQQQYEIKDIISKRERSPRKKISKDRGGYSTRNHRDERSGRGRGGDGYFF